MLIIKLLSQHVSDIIMPIIRRTKTVYYCIWCSAMVVLAVVVWSWIVSCVYTSISTCFGHHYANRQENKERVLLHMVFCTGCAGCGCVDLGRKLCVHFYLNMFRTSLCPSSGQQRPCITAYGVLHWLCWLWLCGVGS